jgi:stalled ribosome rescue protein Dom34
MEPSRYYQINKINQEADMTMRAGIWVDHRKAVIVMVSADVEETMEIRSNVERQPGRIDGIRSTTPYETQLVNADDSQERKFTAQLDQYYEEVTAAIRAAESILIFGPGEAKGELENHLEKIGLGGNIIALETADSMTNRQIAAKVRDYFDK